MILQLRRWLPHRPLVLVGDSSYAVLDLLHCCQSLAQPVTLIARLRLEPAPPRQPGQNGGLPTPARAHSDRPPVLGHRVGSLVRRHYPHVGTHVANGGLVPLGQAAGAPALGLGSGPPRRIHSPAPSGLEWVVLLVVTFPIWASGSLRRELDHPGPRYPRRYAKLAVWIALRRHVWVRGPGLIYGKSRPPCTTD